MSNTLTGDLSSSAENRSALRSVDSAYSTWRLALLIAIHIATAVLALTIDRWFVWAGVWAIQAINLLGLVALVHECVHSHFVSRRLSNRIIGTLASAFIFAHFEVYRSRHIGHHADTSGPDDTEGPPFKFGSRKQIVFEFFISGIAYIATLPALGAAVSLGWQPSWAKGATARRRIRINQVVWFATIGLAAALVANFGLRDVAFVWFVPVALFLSGPFVFVLLPEHYDSPGPVGATSNSRTCISNPLMRFVFFNTNLHTAHHDRPAVPWNKLPEHHADIEARIDDEWVFSGYLAFYKFMWRTVDREPVASNHAPAS